MGKPTLKKNLTTTSRLTRTSHFYTLRPLADPLHGTNQEKRDVLVKVSSMICSFVIVVCAGTEPLANTDPTVRKWYTGLGDRRRPVAKKGKIDVDDVPALRRPDLHKKRVSISSVIESSHDRFNMFQVYVFWTS